MTVTVEPHKKDLKNAMMAVALENFLNWCIDGKFFKKRRDKDTYVGNNRRRI